MEKERKLVFISHANPEDNVFTNWLAARLTSLGYLVWSDVTKLFGAELFWDDIEDAIKNHSMKVIVVLSEIAQQKGGVLDEISVAVGIERTEQIERFVVPIKIDDLSFNDIKPNLIRKNIIDFNNKWAEGFNSLIKVLERDNVPKCNAQSNLEISMWIEQMLSSSQKLVPNIQPLLSNWVKFKKLPKTLNFYRVPIEAKLIRDQFIDSPFSVYPFKDMAVTFATANDIKKYLPFGYEASLIYSPTLESVISSQPFSTEKIEWNEISNMFYFLIRTSWDKEMKSRGLLPYEMSNGKLAWFFAKQDGDIPYTNFVDIDNRNRKKKLIGYSDKYKVFWHFAIQVVPIIGKEFKLTLKPHVVFTLDGKSPLDDHKKMHRLRRSFCRSWWNDRWRGLILAYLAALSIDEQVIPLDAGSEQTMGLESQPIIYESPVSLEELDSEIDSSDETDEMLDQIAEYIDFNLSENEDDYDDI